MPHKPVAAIGSEKQQAVGLLVAAATPERRHVVLGIVFLCIAAGLEALGPLLGKAFIDRYLLPHQIDKSVVLGLLATYVLTGWAATWLRYLQLTRLAGVAMRSVRRLREQVYSHVLRLPMSFFDQAITGQLVSRVTNDTEAVKNLYVQVLFVMLDSSIVVLGALVAMAWLDWHLMLIVLLLIPAVVIIVWFYQRWSAPAVTRARQLRSEINAQVAESISGMSALQACNAERGFGQRFADTNRLHYTARLDELRANAWLLRPALDLLNSVLLVVVIYCFGQRDFSAIEVGVLYAFVSYIARVVDPLIQITLQFGQIQQAIVSAARVNALLQETIVPQHSSDALITHGELAIASVDFAYTPGYPVLQQISLQIPAGSFFGVVGHTGSGKSTLMSLLLRFYTAQAGSIRIDGQPLAAFSEAHFRASVGLVPQEPFLLAASAGENISMGRNLSQAEIERAARAAHVHDFILQLEDGYATALGEGGARLSTGQKQLVAIARALAGRPRILFLDEATSHIDSETEQIVQLALAELRGQVTVVAIAHRLSTIRDADSIVVLNHGHVAEQGRHQELMQIDQGLYQKLYLLQTLEE
ncbi:MULTISPECIES: ABC transporter ATP-binding protein [unclassified Undibacterium]|uniref:ABC transporter ATP-binding protein n=1 Tax=unclassified Undibacterium TaxID=2630295 RepID=UPI002AC93A8E|nr:MULTISPECIES: ABC transporter transmembrane domain-containing protein [unclassified Undibacterium]MEB0140854.1 ABC transporter transmembrane domain-containing protein [Undibacterium sp. CCC2.1]MEB0173834.1 ABC transporter transmembrane domain-containing protein [Undibacterium sp. CCC1.1]MEB0177807.1 ABC transporter transmembrane domain-containing protein [Undibacterium sp. CCC3.4]MEB0216689.1 ABC transporter transmembrane domain-containing protein [Undibacterium sp. 5I2]WPX44371.1 ABC trans